VVITNEMKEKNRNARVALERAKESIDKAIARLAVEGYQRNEPDEAYIEASRASTAVAGAMSEIAALRFLMK
jgi:hypothetical protein